MTPEARAYKELILFIAEEICAAEENESLLYRWIGNLWSVTTQAFHHSLLGDVALLDDGLSEAWRRTLDSLNKPAEKGNMPETFLRLSAKIEELKAWVNKEYTRKEVGG